jgi:hypothetical protein
MKLAWYQLQFPHAFISSSKYFFIHDADVYMMLQTVLAQSLCFFGNNLESIVIRDVIKIYMKQVEPKKFGLLANWQREYSMEDILTQLKKEMAAPHNRKLVQPPEGTYF